MINMIAFKPGCYIDKSAGSAYDLNKRVIEFAVSQGMVEPSLPVTQLADDEFRADVLREEADDAVTWLNDHTAMPYSYWVIDDNSLFLRADVESAGEDVEFVSRGDTDDTTDTEDASYPCASFRGEWLHVTDHGNVTLYVRGDTGEDTEIWSV